MMRLERKLKMKKLERRKEKQVTTNPHVGVSREHYDWIADIANECDMKLSDVANFLLEVARDYVDVKEIQITTKRLCKKK